MAEIKVWHCHRCLHDWAGRGKVEKPKRCPRCKSPYWATARKNKKVAYG